MTTNRYKKFAAVKELEALAMEAARKKHPTIPEHVLAPRKYRDDKANNLTKCIIDWIRLNGFQAERISVTGRYIDNTKVVTNVIGQQQRIGSREWIPSSMQKGSADISATINGRSVKIEVKAGRDRQREAQKNYQQQIEAAGGIYIIARSFEEFLTWYKYFVR
jgi:hypothetical protein